MRRLGSPMHCAFGAAVLLAALSGPAHAADPASLVTALAKPGAAEEAKRLDELPPVSPPDRVQVDHSGRKEKGKASIYSHSFDGRTMANGKHYDPHADMAASKSLPLGTTAKVTNLENGKSTKVKVEDRGPFVKGRVVDLAPTAAAKLGLTKKAGLASVVVAPITVPQSNGDVKAGAGAAEIVGTKAAEDTSAASASNSR